MRSRIRRRSTTGIKTEVSEYTNGWGRLPGVKEDVVAVGKLFKELGFNVVTMVNVNRNNLRNGIEDFLNEYGYSEDSRLIIYFAGHGATLDLGRNRKMGYIVPVDAPLSDARDFSNRAIPMSQFETWAKNTKARHILFIFDSCFSGTVFSATRSAVSPAIDRLINQPVRQFITSGDANEKVPDTSIFRKQLEYALRDGLADPYKTGYVSGTALGMFLYETVANYSNGRQHPQFGKINDVDLDKGDFVFVVGGKQPSSSTPPVAAAQVQPSPVVVQPAPSVEIRGTPLNKTQAATVKKVSKDVINRLPANSTVAVLSIESSDSGVSFSVINEIMENLIISRKLSVVDRSSLNRSLVEVNFQWNEPVSDETAIRMGQLLGANIVITGSISGSGSSRFLRLRVLEVKTGRIIFSTNVKF